MTEALDPLSDNDIVADIVCGSVIRMSKQVGSIQNNDSVSE